MALRQRNIELMEGLRAARQQGLPWHHLARLLQVRFEGEGNWGRRTEVWEEAAKVTGFQPVVLKRFLTLINRIDQVSHESGMPAAELVSQSYGAVEIALRLYDRNTAAGLEALSDLRERRATIDALQKKLFETPAGSADPAAVSRSVSLRERGSLVERCETALRENAGTVFGAGRAVSRRPALRHFRRLGFEISTGGRIIAGADLHLPEPSDGSKDSPDGLAQSLLLARYLPAFYLAFAPGVPAATVEAVGQALDVLGIASVGILEIDGTSGVRETRPALQNAAATSEDYEAVKAALTIRRRTRELR